MFNRILNLQGQSAYDKFSTMLSSLLGLVVVFYAAFRAKSYTTQLPAIFSTTTAPKQLPIAYVDDIFPDEHVPALFDSFEFPAFTVCALEQNASVSAISCQYTTGITKKECVAPINRYIDVGAFGKQLPCITFNEAPAPLIVVTSSDDTLYLQVKLDNVPHLGLDGLVGLIHPQLGASRYPFATFDNTFASSSNTIVEVELEKVWQLALSKVNQIDYHARANAIKMFKQFAVVDNTTNADFISSTANLTQSITKFQLKYPRLEIVYEKEFLALSKNSWLGEIGGFAALLLFLHRFIMSIVMFVLCRYERYSESNYSALDSNGNNLNGRFQRFQ